MILSDLLKVLYEGTEKGNGEAHILQATDFLPPYGSTGYPRRADIIRQFFPEPFLEEGSETALFLCPAVNARSAQEKLFNRFLSRRFIDDLADAFHRQVKRMSGTAGHFSGSVSNTSLKCRVISSLFLQTN